MSALLIWNHLLSHPFGARGFSLDPDCCPAHGFTRNGDFAKVKGIGPQTRKSASGSIPPPTALLSRAPQAGDSARR